MSKSLSFLTFLALQRARIARLGRTTPHAVGIRKPSLADVETPPDPLEVEEDDE